MTPHEKSFLKYLRDTLLYATSKEDKELLYFVRTVRKNKYYEVFTKKYALITGEYRLNVKLLTISPCDEICVGSKCDCLYFSYTRLYKLCEPINGESVIIKLIFPYEKIEYDPYKVRSGLVVDYHLEEP